MNGEKTIYNYVDDNVENWNSANEKEFSEMIENHRAENTTCTDKEYLESKISNLVKYKNNSLNIKQLEEEILMLENYNYSGQDLMSSMRAKAGKTGKVIYAIIWLILLLQMITLLAMYYKRIIMVAILLMIFPVVMITYAIDKISDGKAQTLETWTKEFTVNIIVQIAHAIVYVFLIQTGLEIYEANPDNWLFLVLAVMVLFPVERMFRTLFGINGSTIGNLKGNIAGGVAAAALAYKAAKGTAKLAVKGAKGAYNLGKDVKNDGVSKTVKNKANNIKKAWNNYGSSEAKAKKTQDKKRQAAANRKKNARDMNIQRRREQMEKAGLAKKAMLKTMNAASMVRNGMYHVGNAERKLSRGTHKLQNSFVGKSFKLASASVRKVAGVGMGISSGVTNAVINSGKNGMAAATVQGAKIGQTVNSMVGGSRPKPKAPSKTVPTVGGTPYHFRKNMPAGQKYKRAKAPAYQKVKNKTTRSKTTNTRIKGVKKTIKDEEN